MALLTFTPETGAGLANSNSYVAISEADPYFNGHLYSEEWQTMDLKNRQRALIMATRLIDQQFQFYGYKRLATQALQWPRAEVPDPDNQVNRIPNLGFREGDVLPEDEVPQAVKDATCETALKLLESNRTADPDGEGLADLEIVGAIKMSFKSTDRKPVLPREANVLLTKYGFSLSGGGSVKLTRG